MFGLNDNTQTNDNTPENSPAAPEPMPSNPFGESSPSIPPAPVPAPPEPTSGPGSSYTAPSLPAEPSASTSSSMSDSASASTTPSSGSDLMDIKQQALQSLQPLVSHLDQSPEEKFKTTMMMIQATDNSDLVKQAYEIANKITDEKARAQALLDVVNEINYFTHKDDKK